MDAEQTPGISASLLHSNEAYRDAEIPIRLSPGAVRLRWSVNGPLTTAIRVMQGQWINPDATTEEPYYQQATDGDGDAATWHAVSCAPLTEPKISSVTVEVDPLELWEYNWLQQNEPFPDEPTGFGVVGEQPRDKEARPEVKAAPGEFLTVHDYISAVHPWLMGLRGDILAALGLEAQKDEALPEDTKLMVAWFDPQYITVVDEEEWVKQFTKPVYL